MVRLPTRALRAAWLGRRYTSDTVRVEVEDYDTMQRTEHLAEIIGQYDGWTKIHLTMDVVGGMIASVYHDARQPYPQQLRRANGDRFEALVRLCPEQPDHDNIGELADLDRHILTIRDREEDRQAAS